MNWFSKRKDQETLSGRERELLYYDTVPLPDEQLIEARDSAKVQRGYILRFFKNHYDHNYTPLEVYNYFRGCLMLNSVRRTITCLTKEGRLIKCDWSERRMGGFGRDNRTWRYRRDYIKPIN